MATLPRRLRQLGVTSMFILSGLVGTFWGQVPFIPLPPPVQFTNNGQLAGTFQTQGTTLPFTGTVDNLDAGGVQNTKLELSVDIGGQQITSDTWVTVTPTVITEWEIVSTDPTTCRKEVLSGDSYPQCAAWQNPAPNQWSIECAVTAQGNKKATVDTSYALSGNLIVSLVENTTFRNKTDSLKIAVDSQGSFPPDISVFNLPSICN